MVFAMGVGSLTKPAATNFLMFIRSICLLRLKDSGKQDLNLQHPNWKYGALAN